MERELAIKVVKQILESCGSCQSVTLVLDSSSHAEVDQIQLNSNLSSDYNTSIIEKIAKRNELQVDRKGNTLVIYRPKNLKK